MADALLQAATLLAPLPCMCGTGTESDGQHGRIESLVFPVQHPHAPYTATAAVGRCRVCGQVWVMTEEGDDHYDWRYSMVPFRGPEV